MIEQTTTPRLIIFSGVRHHTLPGLLRAHGGFVREIDIWADIFPQVVVAAPTTTEPPLADSIVYGRKNIVFYPIASYRRHIGLPGKLQLLSGSLRKILRALSIVRENDVIMARGPDSIGFLGWIITRFTSYKRFAKYADQWETYSGEPGGFRIQKEAYRHPSFGGPVMIYGKPDPRRPHLVPFVTSSVSRAEWERAAELIRQRPEPPPFRALFVGRLTRSKGVDVILKALPELLAQGIPITVEIVGDGPLRSRLEHLAAELGVRQAVTFHGWLGGDDLAVHYARAHCFIHSSRLEGFGKVLIEAMTYNLPIIGSDVGVSQMIVAPPSRGILITPDNPQALAQAIRHILANPDLANRMGCNGRVAAQQMVLEGLEMRYRQFLNAYVSVSL